MPKRISLLALCLVAICFHSSAQSFENQCAKFTAFNVGFIGLASRLGAIINKSDEEKSGAVFWLIQTR